MSTAPGTGEETIAGRVKNRRNKPQHMDTQHNNARLGKPIAKIYPDLESQAPMDSKQDEASQPQSESLENVDNSDQSEELLLPTSPKQSALSRSRTFSNQNTENPKKDLDQHETPQSKTFSANRYYWKIAILILVLAISIGIFCYYTNRLQNIKSTVVTLFLSTKLKLFGSSPSGLNQTQLDQKLAAFDELLKTPEFNENVPVYGVRILRNAFMSALYGSANNSPVFILLMATFRQSEIIRSISHRIANLLETGKVDNSWPHSIQIMPSHTERDIETFYNETFDSRKRSVLVLENLEQLNPSNAMVFHQFTDGENSVIKSSFTIATLKYKQQLTVNANISLKRLSEISTEELNFLWKESWSNDNLDCLINRMAEKTVVLVNSK